MATWGEPQDCEAAVYLKALGALMPPPPPGAGGPFALSQPGALEALVTEAGFEPGERTDVDCPFAYPDLETALRGLLGAGPAEVAIRHAGEAAARAAVTEAIAPFATADGGYVMENRSASSWRGPEAGRLGHRAARRSSADGSGRRGPSARAPAGSSGSRGRRWASRGGR